MHIEAMGAAPAAATGTTLPALDAAGATNVGRHRRRNEDAYLIATLQRSMLLHDASPEAARGWFAGESAGTLLIVADGMGGHASGDVASRVAVETIAGYVLNVMPWAARGQVAADAPTAAPQSESAPREATVSLPGVREQLSTAIMAGDSTVKSTGVMTGAPQMGTTLTAAFVLWPIVYVAHVGDTRCSIFRSGALIPLTTDHTLAQQIAERNPEAADVPFAWHNILWNCLGGSSEVPRPQITKSRLEVGDTLLLCSDGLTKHVSDEEIVAVLGGSADNASRCAALIDRANAAGGSDNITVIAATVRAS